MGDPHDEDQPDGDDEGLSNYSLEKFTEELENMMIAGHSTSAIERWAFLGYKMDRDQLEQLKVIIRRNWALESQSIHQVRARRDALRVKYLHVYDCAMASEKYLPAIKALDSIAKMDGLMQPDVNLTQINMDSPGQSTQITNGVRERIAQLAETMRLRSEKRQERLEGKVIDIVDTKKNGTNGH